MNYEITELKEMKVAGIAARTNNASPDMEKVIEGLWLKLCVEGVEKTIPGKCSEKVVGIYTDYDSDETGDYSVIAGCETDGTGELPDSVIRTVIPAGKYAKFVVRGHMVHAVADFWRELWEMDLNRSYVCDFEEYQNDSMEDSEIHIYIGLKE